MSLIPARALLVACKGNCADEGCSIRRVGERETVREEPWRRGGKEEDGKKREEEEKRFN